MTKVGCRHLVAGQYPGAERVRARDRARPVDLLQSLGILTTPADGRIVTLTGPTCGRLAQGGRTVAPGIDYDPGGEKSEKIGAPCSPTE